MQEFKNKEEEYLDWINGHWAGFVVNSSKDHRHHLKLHHANCPTIAGPPSKGKKFTESYIKVCFDDKAELKKWALGKNLTFCPRCQTSPREIKIAHRGRDA